MPLELAKPNPTPLMATLGVAPAADSAAPTTDPPVGPQTYSLPVSNANHTPPEGRSGIDKV
jgi:hypothetical protein